MDQQVVWHLRAILLDSSVHSGCCVQFLLHLYRFSAAEPGRIAAEAVRVYTGNTTGQAHQQVSDGGDLPHNLGRSYILRDYSHHALLIKLDIAR